jgi:hypothetical protein
MYGRSVAQVPSRQIPTAKAAIQFQVSACAYWRSIIRTDPSSTSLVFLCPLPLLCKGYVHTMAHGLAKNPACEDIWTVDN